MHFFGGPITTMHVVSGFILVVGVGISASITHRYLFKKAKQAAIETGKNPSSKYGVSIKFLLIVIAVYLVIFVAQNLII